MVPSDLVQELSSKVVGYTMLPNATAQQPERTIQTGIGDVPVKAGAELDFTFPITHA
ncbi:MAG: hypothetical protein ABR568_00850 [Pyrinomonadaceae bacterium]